jgi:hypothetical protein
MAKIKRTKGQTTIYETLHIEKLSNTNTIKNFQLPVFRRCSSAENFSIVNLSEHLSSPPVS